MKISKKKFEKLLEKACEIYVNNEYKESIKSEEEMKKKESRKKK